jgi:hypothetical protein
MEKKTEYNLILLKEQFQIHGFQISPFLFLRLIKVLSKNQLPYKAEDRDFLLIVT